MLFFEKKNNNLTNLLKYFNLYHSYKATLFFYKIYFKILKIMKENAQKIDYLDNG